MQAQTQSADWTALYIFGAFFGLIVIILFISFVGNEKNLRDPFDENEE